MSDSTANDQPSNQFSLRRMFAVTALAAGFVLAWKNESFLVWFMSYLATCRAFACTGIKRSIGPVRRGLFAGALIPAAFFAAILPSIDEHLTALQLVKEIIIGGSMIGLFGSMYGLFAGILAAEGIARDSTRTSPPA